MLGATTKQLIIRIEGNLLRQKMLSTDRLLVVNLISFLNSFIEIDFLIESIFQFNCSPIKTFVSLRCCVVNHYLKK